MKYSIDVANMIRSRAKPLPIWICAPIMMVWGALGILFVLLAASSPGSFSLEGVEFSGAGHFFIVFPAVLTASLVQLFTGYGLFTERLWARGFATKGAAAVSAMFMLIYMQAGVPPTNVLRGGAPGFILLALTFWYFYRYEPVVEYYNRLEWEDVTAEE